MFYTYFVFWFFFPLSSTGERKRNEIFVLFSHSMRYAFHVSFYGCRTFVCFSFSFSQIFLRFALNCPHISNSSCASVFFILFSFTKSFQYEKFNLEQRVSLSAYVYDAPLFFFCIFNVLITYLMRFNSI